MNVAIVGAGNIGSGLASVLAKTSHSIAIVDAQSGVAAATKLQEHKLRLCPWLRHADRSEVASE